MSFTPEVMRLRQRRGSQAEWNAANAVPLLEGEIGWEQDTERFKVGNAAGDDWATLDYWGGSQGPQGPQGPEGPPGPVIVDGGGP